MMTTLSHSNSRAHAYAERAGIRLLQAIEAAGTDLFTAFQATEVGAPLGLSSRHTVTLLHRLTTAKRSRSSEASTRWFPAERRCPPSAPTAARGGHQRSPRSAVMTVIPTVMIASPAASKTAPARSIRGSGTSPVP
jgi:hypothetical protein